MIVIHMAAMQDKVIALLENLDGDFTYKFSEKKGIKLFFDVTKGAPDQAVVVAKNAIKAEPWGTALYFNTEVV